MTDEGLIALLELVRGFLPEWAQRYGLTIVILGTALKPVLKWLAALAAKGADRTAAKWDNQVVQVISTGLDYLGATFDVARRVMPGMGFGPLPARQAITTRQSRRPPPIKVPPPIGARLNSIPPIAAVGPKSPRKLQELVESEAEPVPVAAASMPPAYYERPTDPGQRPRHDTPTETLAAKTKRLREEAQRRG